MSALNRRRESEGRKVKAAYALVLGVFFCTSVAVRSFEGASRATRDRRLGRSSGSEERGFLLADERRPAAKNKSERASELERGAYAPRREIA